ncbi:MAG TPA: hypothetical protein VHS52_02000 [Acidimicrobiales bacterium]|nr:hypothetical protein [Acidimicrobiales bacterium]
MKQLSGLGFAIDLPDGWDGRIYRRPEEANAASNRALHAATFPLPDGLGDFAASAVEHMAESDVLVVLLEYDREAAGTALFASEGLPTSLRPDSFNPNAMPKIVPGKTGAQYFFTLAGRAFCLFVVLGSHNDRVRLASLATSVTRSIKVNG